MRVGEMTFPRDEWHPVAVATGWRKYLMNRLTPAPATLRRSA